MSFNMKNASKNNNSFSVLPHGRYVVRIDKAEKTEAKNGRPMLALEMTVIYGQYENRKLWHRLTLDTDKTEVFIYSLLKAVRSELIESENIELSDVINELLNKTCTVLVEVSKYNDSETNNTKNFMTVTEDEQKLMDLEAKVASANSNPSTSASSISDLKPKNSLIS